MPIIEDIRRLDSQGVSGRQIAKQLGVSRDSVAKYSQMEDFSLVPVVKKFWPTGGVLEGHTDFIDQVLEADKKAPRKQRHTAKRIYDRLVAERGYEGSYRTVSSYVAKWRRAWQEQEKVFAELSWAPGSAQVDFGAVTVIDGLGQKISLSMLVVTLPYSNSRYAQLYQGENSESVCHGLQTIFSYLGFVPHTIVFDNAAGIGRRVGPEEVKETALFQRFRAHHRFTSRFCNTYSGNEKGSVENAVGYIRRNLFVPLPTVIDIKAFNEDLLDRCEALSNQTHYRAKIPISALFEEDKREGLPLPRSAFTPARFETRRADKAGRIKIENSYYLADPNLYGLDVPIGIHHDHIEIFNPQGISIRILPRDYANSATTITDPEPLLSLVAVKPGSWRESSLRPKIPLILATWIDNASFEDKSRSLKHLNKAVENGCDFHAAMNAATTLIQRGDRIEEASLTLLARRIGTSHQPNPGVDLGVYDKLAKVGDTK